MNFIDLFYISLSFYIFIVSIFITIKIINIINIINNKTYDKYCDKSDTSHSNCGVNNIPHSNCRVSDTPHSNCGVSDTPHSNCGVSNITENNYSNYNEQHQILINKINKYFDLFIELNLDRKTFNAIFNIDKLLFDDNIHIFYSILMTNFSKYYNPKYNDFYPIKINLIDKDKKLIIQQYFCKFYNIKTNNKDFNELKNNVIAGKYNVICLDNLNEHNYNNYFSRDKTRMLYETDIEYEIKILNKILEYFDDLYIIYKKYQFYGIKFN